MHHRLLHVVSQAVPVTAVAASLVLLTGASPTTTHTGGPAGGLDLVASAPRTTVDPGHLGRGADPRVAWYDRRSGTIHDGSRTVHAGFRGPVVALAKVRGGYLLVNQREDEELSTTFRFVGPHGRSRVLARGSAARLDTVSADGGRFGYQAGSPRRFVVRRVADGTVLQARSFARGGRVVAIGRHRTLLTQGASAYWWTPGRSRLVRYATEEATGADLSAGRVALVGASDNRSHAASVPRDSQPRWSTPGYERIGSFSYDDRLVLSLGHVAEESDEGYSLVRVRGEQHGVVKRTFRALVEPGVDVRWESARTFLALVRVRHTAPGTGREAWVRCGVAGSCVKAGPDFDVDVDSGERAPWVVAMQRTS